MESFIETTLEVDRVEHIMELFGDFDKNIQIIEEAFDVKIISRDNKIKISGSSEGVVKAETVIKRLINLVTEGDIITKQSVSYLVQLANDNEMKMVNGFCADYVCVTARGRQIKCKTHGQKKYVEAMKNNDVVFGIGPAGTGKTFLAVAMAVTAFKKEGSGQDCAYKTGCGSRGKAWFFARGFAAQSRTRT